MRLKGDSSVEYRFELITKLHKEGKKQQQQIAALVGCSRAWVSKVLQRYKAQGNRGLKVKGKARGKQSLLCMALLLKGALRQGFTTDNRTRRRIATVIEQHFKVHYSAAPISRLMRRLGFTVQQPKRTSFKKDPQQVTKGTDLTGTQKKAQTEDYLLLYSDECSISVVSTLTHTYAPKGQTPVITTSTEINLRLCVASAISPAGGLQYRIRKQPFDSAAIITYLEHLQQAFGQRKLLIIRDGTSIHDSDKVRTYLSSLKDKQLHVARQPHYSPELNADEQVWSYLKQHQLNDTCNPTAAILHTRITKVMNSMQQQPDLIQSFFHHPDLGFYN